MHEFLIKGFGLSLGLLGMIPLFTVATAKAETLKNLCFATGLVHLAFIGHYLARYRAFSIDHGVPASGLDAKLALTLVSAALCFAGAGFSPPTCARRNVAWGALEVYVLATALLWGSSLYLTTDAVVATHGFDAESPAIPWVASATKLNGLALLVSPMVFFAVLASKDEAARRKFAQLYGIYSGLQLGVTATVLGACGSLGIDTAGFYVNGVIFAAGLYSACKAQS